MLRGGSDGEMQLTKWTDYSLRVLLHCAAHAERDAPVTIDEIVHAHGISRSHLTKVVMSLAAQGYLATTRGRGGGLRLLAPASATRVGEVVRRTEADLTLLECFDPVGNTCRLAGRCQLEAVLHEALARFMEVLDGLTLADLLARPKACTSAALPLPVPVHRRPAGARKT